jgi:hypothetical protein
MRWRVKVFWYRPHIFKISEFIITAGHVSVSPVTSHQSPAVSLSLPTSITDNSTWSSRTTKNYCTTYDYCTCRDSFTIDHNRRFTDRRTRSLAYALLKIHATSAVQYPYLPATRREHSTPLPAATGTLTCYRYTPLSPTNDHSTPLLPSEEDSNTLLSTPMRIQ